MAGRGGRGAMLEALLARQQRPGAQNGQVADGDEVMSMVFQWSEGELVMECIWFLGQLGDTFVLFCRGDMYSGSYCSQQHRASQAFAAVSASSALFGDVQRRSVVRYFMLVTNYILHYLPEEQGFHFPLFL